MRIDVNGSYTGQWLFDAAILTTVYVNGKDIYHGHGWSSDYLNGQDIHDLIDMLVHDATHLDRAIKSLSTKFGTSPGTLQVFIGFPYLHPANTDLNINGNHYDLSDPHRRLSASKLILDILLDKLLSREWNYLNFGIYYHREDVVSYYDDATYIQRFNEHVHYELDMKTVWVPYYDSPEWAFNGTDLGFDHVVIKPRYSFLSSIDSGILKGDRIYSTGFKAAGQGQCMAYEARSHGESELEYYMAHQYLSVSLNTRCYPNEQVFFVGRSKDIFDKVKSRSSAKGRMWDTYVDLVDYLDEQWIFNLEFLIGDGGVFRDVSSNLREYTWEAHPDWHNMNSIRMDFNDPSQTYFWRGGLSVLVEGDRTRSSFAYRVGTDDINPTYNSVFVPLSNIPIQSGTRLVIQLSREDKSPWPNVRRISASKDETLFVANPAFSAISSSSAMVPTNGYQDSQPTHTRFAAGKLTDGRINSDWWSDNAVGWSQMEKRITITIDLGSVRHVSSVRIHSWNDYPSSVRWPRRMGVLAAVDCEPQERGTLNGCVPTASSGTAVLRVDKAHCGTHCDRATLTANFGRTVAARYITVSMVALLWCLLDEVQVLDAKNVILSNGAAYRVTPVPGFYTIEQHRDKYSSDGQNLADGAIFRDFIWGERQNVVGFHNEEGTVELSWIKPLTNVTYAVIWITNANMAWGIGLPSTVDIQWRAENGIWQTETTVSVNAINQAGVCTASPCAALRLPEDAKVTGVRGTIPQVGHWTMVSEISIV